MSRHAFQNVFFVYVREAIILIAAKRSQVKQVTPESSRLLATDRRVEGFFRRGSFWTGGMQKLLLINAVQVEVDNGLGKIGYFKGVLPRCIGCVGWVGVLPPLQWRSY